MGDYRGCLLLTHIPIKRINWRWLKQLFGYHGKVLDAFIPNKRNAANKMFGFIRYAYLAEARRAIERMNDFWMYKHRLGVNLARFKGRSSFRKRKHMDKKIHDSR
ncbi:hypothetical protein E1A91_D11G224300v1 [Gossypium mustelinum]|uniref:RRM domain-containing protein n=1 Tax=Gossypium mustelinum TaxID=34275 RepID=A0A5D2SW21_GOSMU|nr:hypothetical protein E1A91_D11G224300v1 [Gossypium mustelinum]